MFIAQSKTWIKFRNFLKIRNTNVKAMHPLTHNTTAFGSSDSAAVFNPVYTMKNMKTAVMPSSPKKYRKKKIVKEKPFDKEELLEQI